MSRIDLCGKYFVPLRRDSVGSREYAVVPVRCGSWECPECRKRKAEAYRKRIGKLFDGRPLYFLTLTYFHNVSAEEAWKTYNAAWNRLKSNLTKKVGTFSFVRVLESHEKSPYPHLHLIIDKEIKPTVLNRAALQAGFGYQMEFKKVTSEIAAIYITKYLTKEWNNATSLSIIKKNRVRRISFSRDIVCDNPGRAGWTLIGCPTGMETAVETITADREFDTTGRFDLRDSVEREDFILLLYDFDEVPRDFFRRADLEEWEPDDWVPK